MITEYSTEAAVQPFDFSGQQVRVVTDGQGEPWFVARDVCGVLDLPNVSQAAKIALPADEAARQLATAGAR